MVGQKIKRAALISSNKLNMVSLIYEYSSLLAFTLRVYEPLPFFDLIIRCLYLEVLSSFAYMFLITLTPIQINLILIIPVFGIKTKQSFFVLGLYFN